LLYAVASNDSALNIRQPPWFSAVWNKNNVEEEYMKRRVQGAVSQSLRVISASALSENYLSSSAPRAIHTLSEEWRAKVMSTTIGVNLPAHPFFLATLFVPQSRSLPERPHPIVTAFLKAGQRNVIKHDRV
jgi:hypothetical protein